MLNLSILPEQVSLAELCGKQQVFSLLSRNLSQCRMHRKIPSPNSLMREKRQQLHNLISKNKSWFISHEQREAYNVNGL